MGTKAIPDDVQTAFRNHGELEPQQQTVSAPAPCTLSCYQTVLLSDWLLGMLCCTLPSLTGGTANCALVRRYKDSLPLCVCIAGGGHWNHSMFW